MRQLLSGNFAMVRYYLAMVETSSPQDSDLAADLARLEEPVLAEVVREGEQMVDAQFIAMSAADQRALTLAGVAVTLAGAAVGLLVTRNLPDRLVPNWMLLSVLTVASLMLVGAAILAVVAAMPRRAQFPGNEPENWRPQYWQAPHHGKNTLRNARVEQALVLQAKIASNRIIAAHQAELVRRSIYLGFSAVGGGAIAILAAFLVGSIRT
jgi:hypothetical protein